MTRGSDGLRRERVVGLARLDLGRFDVGRFDVGQVDGRPGKRLIPISGWLITTDSGRHLLFDTGFPPAYATDPRAMAEADGLDGFGQLVDYRPQHTITGALALHNLTPADISHVLLSHSHIDHVGGLPLFTDAEVILSARERSEPRPSYFGAARPMAWPQARYRLLAKTTGICQGLRMIATPGHTAGHMSALVTVSGQPVLLAADAINRHSEPAEGYPDAADPVQAARSGSGLLRLAQRLGAMLIPGHQPVGTDPVRDRWP